MKNSMAKKIVCIILTILLLLATNVYGADDSFKTKITASSSNVKREKNITVTIALKDIAIKSGEKGIAAYTANIEFDSSVLEYVSSKGKNGWEAPLYQDGAITATTNNGEVVKKAQSIGTITFKVKSNAKLGQTTIKLTNFLGSTGISDVEAKDSSVKVTISEAEKSTSTTKNKNTNSTTNENVASENVVVSENTIENTIENVIQDENIIGNIVEDQYSNIENEQYVSDYYSTSMNSNIENDVEEDGGFKVLAYILIGIIAFIVVILIIRFINKTRSRMKKRRK